MGYVRKWLSNEAHKAAVFSVLVGLGLTGLMLFISWAGLKIDLFSDESDLGIQQLLNFSKWFK